jgi:F-type H+-transporting ATPase subunit a
MFPVEVLGIFTKPIALMIRLFANMVAGHIIVLSLISLIFVFGKAGQSVGGSAVGALIAVPFTLFISLIEVLVAFIQAFIFATLVSVFIGMAVEEHGHEGEEHH